MVPALKEEKVSFADETYERKKGKIVEGFF